MARRIMVPLDGLSSGEGALEVVERMGSGQDLDVLLVSVWRVEEECIGGDPIHRKLASQVLECASRNLKAYLNRTQERLHERGIASSVLVLPGRTDADLSALAREHGVDAIVMDPRGQQWARCQRPPGPWCSGPCPLPL